MSTELDLDQARAAVLDGVEAVADIEALPLAEVLSRVLAADLRSPVNVPPHDNAAMDGYALRQEALDRPTPVEPAEPIGPAEPVGPIRLRVAGRALAGQPWLGPWQADEAIRIMTGAALPPGTAAVIAQEQVQTLDPAGSFILVPAGLPPGLNCRRAGEDLERGQIALPAGRVLSPADIGLAASLGLATLAVRRRLRVAVLSTGDELLAAGQMPQPDRIFDSNRPLLLATLQRLGYQTEDLGVVGDDPQRLRTVLAEASRRHDVILSSGGVSVGEADHTRAVMAALGPVVFASIAMRPGRPLAYGRIGDCLYAGLPGNPVAALLAFHMIVRVALERRAGAVPRPLPRLRVQAGAPLRKRVGRAEFQRGRISHRDDGLPEVLPAGAQGSGILRSMTEADVLIELPASQGPVAVGDWIDVIALHGLI